MDLRYMNASSAQVMPQGVYGYSGNDILHNDNYTALVNDINLYILVKMATV